MYVCAFGCLNLMSKGGGIVDGDSGGGFYAYLGFGNYGLPLPVPDCHHVILPTVYTHEPLTVILHQSNTVMIKQRHSLSL